MDILDDMGVSKLSAIFFFFKLNYFKIEISQAYWFNDKIWFCLWFCQFKSLLNNT